MTTILLIEDDDSLREILAMNLEDFEIEVDQAPDGSTGLSMYDPARHDVVLTDLKMPGIGGLVVLDQIKARHPEARVLVLTAFGGGAQALEAMRRGAFHYVEKPVNTTALVAEIQRAALPASASSTRSVGMVAVSPSMNRVLRIVDKVANSNAPVMILGESGVGKELVARAIHERSGRVKRPFVAVNCAAIPADLLESVLFGYEKGAFTGATTRKDGKFFAANGGTLFLDEIAEMSEALQSKLLRVLQDHLVERVGALEPEAVDVRIVTATHQDLEARIAHGTFRADLFYRLNVIPVEIPPLRERREDIPVLFRHFLRALSDGVPPEIDKSVDDALLSYHWPGNIRELRNIVERMSLLREGERLMAEDVPSHLLGQRASDAARGELPFDLPEGGLDLIALEKSIIEAALRQHDGNQSATARYLNIARHILTYRIEKYGIDI